MEFFDDLDREKRGQVWGMTFPLNKSEGGTAGAFAAEFGLLVQRLNERLLDRLQAERSPDRRTAIAGFPGPGRQPAGAAGGIHRRGVRRLAPGSGAVPARRLPDLRHPGRHADRPADRRHGAQLRHRRAARRQPAPGAGPRYFLTRLLKEVVFGEATLVSRDPAAVKRNRLAYVGIAAVAALVALLGAAALIETRAVNTSAIAQSDTALAAYTKAASALPLDPVADGDLPRRGAGAGHGARTAVRRTRPNRRRCSGSPASTRPPSSVRARSQVYIHALDNIFFPRLIFRLEDQMRQKFNNSAFPLPGDTHLPDARLAPGRWTAGR